MTQHSASHDRKMILSLREQLTQRWVQRRLGGIGHERRVTALASTFFGLLEDLHGLGAEYRRILRLGCMVHDVGRSVEDRRHPAIGAEMIQEDTTLPVASQDRRRLAYLTRYHRGAVPEAGFDGILRSGDGRKAMRKVLAILRAADTLDNRNIASPTIAISRKGKKIRINVTVESDHSKARRVFSRRKKFRLLEDLLDCRIEVELTLRETIEAA